MDLHPEVKKDLEKNLKDFDCELTVSEMRTEDKNTIVPMEKRTFIYSVRDEKAVLDNTEISVRVYEPKREENSPVILFIHGGGFVRCSIETHDEVCRNLALYSGWKVISPEYRLAPEFKFPVQIEDCFNTIKWIIGNAEKLKVNPEKIAVCGDSAGGNIAASTAKLAMDMGEISILKQVLIYPVIDYYSEKNGSVYDSYEKNAYGYGLSAKSMNRYWSYYTNSEEYKNNPYLSLTYGEKFSELPEALVITAKYDPLCDEGEYYAKKMREAGVYVETKRYENLNHAFLNALPDLEECKDVYKRIARFLNQEEK